MGAQPASSPAIVWFRRDFRLADNPALSAAAETDRPLILLYIRDEALEGRPIGAASRWWLDKTLKAFDAALGEFGQRLVLRHGDSVEVLKALIAETGAGAVFLNTLPEPAARARDERLADALGVPVRAFEAATLAQPGSVLNGSGLPYKVFTPFYRALRARLDLPDLRARPRRLAAPAARPESERLEDWRLHPKRPDWSEGFNLWTPGEAGAFAALDAFLDGPVNDYPTGRDRPDKAGTSRLSPHLHWGEISPWRVIVDAQAAAHRGDARTGAVEKLMTEVGWREFNHHLLAAFPALPTKSFDPKYAAFPWRDDPQGLEAWRRGLTGYPMVDAGMRELWATGFMHNRVRMVVASFLIKDLMIDWREGEAWFWDTLVDADLANNTANWQWVAGSGADAAPFFRIFNPASQGERFDPDGVYVRRWVPELARLPDRWLHAPWTAPRAVLEEAGVSFGGAYPQPIVAHREARARALAALRSLKQL
ncbi:MAG: deoxyribodipyrimidine photo-lyase [Proteobacteria bacterium]|nr:deoxyribodipyrimidine photo-lyase [Pseudomonadota bacterium]